MIATANAPFARAKIKCARRIAFEACPNVRCRLKGHIIEPKMHKVRHAETSIKCQLEHPTVANTIASIGVRRVEQELHFLNGQIADKA